MTLEEWKEKARASQQNYSNLLSDRVWEKYHATTERDLLWKKIAFVICGFKEIYNKEENKIVDELIEKCIKYGKRSDHVYVAFLFVCAFQNKTEGIHVPIIRVMKNYGTSTTNSYFIDHTGRVYAEWTNFLDENIFDRWWVCVPKNGLYSNSDDQEVEFFDQSNRGKVVQTADKISTAANITTRVTMLAGTVMSFTPLAPFGIALMTGSAIAGVPGAVYGTGRSISKLVDRGRHEQSISFANAESRSCWISTIASVLSFGTMASTTLLVRSAANGGIGISAGVRTLCTSLNVTSVSMNGIGIVNSIFEVASKKSEDITAFDIFQLTTSIFFFTNSLVNFKTANNLVKDAQKATIDSMRNNLKDDPIKKNFDSMFRNTKKQSGKMHGSADFIRGVKRIDNKNDFFETIGFTGNTATVKAKFNRDGLVNINNELIIHPKAFMQINETQRIEILQHSSDLLNEQISIEEFNENVQTICKDNRIKFENQRKASNERIKAAFESIDINDNKLFKKLKQHEIDRLDKVLKESGKKYDEKCLRVGIDFAKMVNCKNVTDFCAAFEYVIRKMNTEVENRQVSNPNPQIQNVKVDEFYFDQIYSEITTSGSTFMNKLSTEFVKLQNACNDANKMGNPQFENKMAAANHYDKHNFFPTIDENNPISIERYFEIAREISSQPITPENSRVTQDGNSLCITYKNNENGNFVVKYQNLADGKSRIATFFYKQKILNNFFFNS